VFALNVRANQKNQRLRGGEVFGNHTPPMKGFIMKTQRLFNQITQKTHMPFYNDGTLIFCTNQRIVKKRFGKSGDTTSDAEYRPWKLAYADWKTKAVHTLETGLPEDVVHCNPMFHVENDILHVSFIAGFPNEIAMNYLLYGMHGPSWNALSEPKSISGEFTSMGFISPRHVCRGNAHSLSLTDRKNGGRFRVNVPFDAIFRATYDPDRPTRILVTGMDEYDVYRTLVYDMDADETLEIKGPAPTYKACLVGNRIVFAYRESEDVEDYQLCVAPLVLEATEKTITLQPM